MTAGSLAIPLGIFVGAGAGGLLRYWLGGFVQSLHGSAFPLGTMAVNISGCLAMGYLAALWSGPGAIRADVKAMILVGVLGGYTTFSAFGQDTLTLVQAGQWLRAAGYAIGSVALSLAAVWLGASLAGKQATI